MAKRARAVKRIAQDLRANEDDAGLPETRPPDPGSRRTRTTGPHGDALADVLDDDEMTGGDFVRNVKQCIDLLRQVGDVAPDPETTRPRPGGGRRLHRGVVAASSVAAVSTVSARVIEKGEPVGAPGGGAADVDGRR